MPINYADYPPNWKTEIRPAILERAGHKCEFCGVPDRWYRITWTDGSDEAFKPCSDEAFYAGENFAAGIGPKPVLIVLTVAHLFDKNPMNCHPKNLAALCQRCHNRHDSEQRKESRRKTEAAKVAALQSGLFD